MSGHRAASALGVLVLTLVLAGCGASSPASPVGALPASPAVSAAPSVTPSATVPPPTPVATPAPTTGLASTPIATAIPVADSSPTPTAAPTPSSCVALGAHTVVVGDTLWKIGQRCGVTVEDLLAANPQITDRRLIHVGDRITVPPPGWPAGVPHLPLSGTGSAVIDGVLSSHEWAGAARIDFLPAVPPQEDGIVTPASLYVMNDATNLYFATVVVGSFGIVNAIIEFDNDDDGVAMEDGDDVILASVYAGQNGSIDFTDDFRYHCPGETTPGRCGPEDTNDSEGYPPPGTEDGAAAGSRAGGVTVVEMSHPFAGGDVAHDIHLAPGEAVGFVLSLNIWTECGTTGQCSVETRLPSSGQHVRVVINPVP
jgi:LysM repeat protein